MKYTIKIFSVFALAILLYACGGPEGKKVEAEAAKEVKETAQESVVYNVDANASEIYWHGSKPLGDHNGTISIKEGSLNVKDGKIMGGSFVIDMKSIKNTDLEDPESNAKLVGHLMSADFFDSEKYPESVFVITDVKKGDTESHIITGNLTMKDSTKSISFGANIKISDTEITADAPQFVIDRTFWSVNYGSKKIFDNLKDKFIHDDMGIKIKLVAKK